MKHTFAGFCALMLLTLTPACAADSSTDSSQSSPSAQTGTTENYTGEGLGLRLVRSKM